MRGIRRVIADNKRMLWIPQCFGHGFLVTSEYAEVLYKTTDYWIPEHERTLAWDDPVLAIDWPIAGVPVLSEKDAKGVQFADAEAYE